MDLKIPLISSIAIYGISRKSSPLYRNAWQKSRCRSECMALCEPHPGHLNPVRVKNTHRGNHFSPDGSKWKNMTTPTRHNSTTPVMATFLRKGFIRYYMDVITSSMSSSLTPTQTNSAIHASMTTALQTMPAILKLRALLLAFSASS